MSESRAVQAALVTEPRSRTQDHPLRRCPSCPQPSPGPGGGTAAPVGLLQPMPLPGSVQQGHGVEDQRRQASCPLCSGAGACLLPSREGRGPGLGTLPLLQGFDTVSPLPSTQPPANRSCQPQIQVRTSPEITRFLKIRWGTCRHQKRPDPSQPPGSLPEAFMAFSGTKLS